MTGDTVMKKVIFLLFILALLMAVGEVQAKKGGPGNGGNGGGDKGGFGSLGDGCVTFLNSQLPGTFSGDGSGIYCNGTDGQISVPVRLRLDTKKFNENDRFYWVWGNCSYGSTEEICVVGAEMKNLQMGAEAEGNGSTIGDGLDWTLMSPTDTTRVEMGIKIDRTHFLYFDQGVLCNDPTSLAGPVWVRCDADKNEDSLCDRWTVSTDPAFPVDGVYGGDAAHACLKTGAFGDFLDYNVIADFTMKVCVIGTDSIVPGQEDYCGLPPAAP